MNISSDALRKDVVQLLQRINAQIEEVEKRARRLGIQPQEVKDDTGNWVMIPLLLAKAQVYSSLVQLQAQNKK